MSGNIEGGKKAAATNKRLYGKDFYQRNGEKGGKLGNPATKGFAHPEHRKKASDAGRKGGSASRRGPSN